LAYRLLLLWKKFEKYWFSAVLVFELFEPIPEYAKDRRTDGRTSIKTRNVAY